MSKADSDRIQTYFRMYAWSVAFGMLQILKGDAGRFEAALALLVVGSWMVALEDSIDDSLDPKTLSR